MKIKKTILLVAVAVTGALIMVYNLVRTARGDVPADERRRLAAAQLQPAE